MVCKKAKELLDKKIKQRNKEDLDENVSRVYFLEGICPYCGSTKINKIYIGATNGMCRETLSVYKLECDSCKKFYMAYKDKFDCKREGLFHREYEEIKNLLLEFFFPGLYYRKLEKDYDEFYNLGTKNIYIS